MIQDPNIEQLVIERIGEVYTDYARVLKDLNDIHSGQMVVLPKDMDHARMMVRVGQHYIDSCHQETMKALTAEY